MCFNQVTHSHKVAYTIRRVCLFKGTVQVIEKEYMHITNKQHHKTMSIVVDNLYNHGFTPIVHMVDGNCLDSYYIELYSFYQWSCIGAD